MLCASQLPACAKEKAVSKPVHGLRGREVQLINMGVGIGLPELGMYVCRHACFWELSIYNLYLYSSKISLTLSVSLFSSQAPSTFASPISLPKSSPTIKVKMPSRVQIYESQKKYWSRKNNNSTIESRLQGRVLQANQQNVI